MKAETCIILTYDNVSIKLSKHKDIQSSFSSHHCNNDSIMKLEHSIDTEISEQKFTEDQA